MNNNPTKQAGESQNSRIMSTLTGEIQNLQRALGGKSEELAFLREDTRKLLDKVLPGIDPIFLHFLLSSLHSSLHHKSDLYRCYMHSDWFSSVYQAGAELSHLQERYVTKDKANRQLKSSLEEAKMLQEQVFLFKSTQFFSIASQNDNFPMRLSVAHF